MKRPTAIMAGALAVVLLSGGTASAAAYFGYDQWGGTWHDANKTPGGPNEVYLCWGASAANVLAWGGWTTSAGATEAAVFQTFKDHWTDAQSLEDRAWRWWISGTEPRDPPGWARVVTPGGGHFAGDFDRLYRASFATGDAMEAVDGYLHDGYGVTLAVFPNTRSGGHSLTAWGYEYDPGSGDYTGLWVTDSDDYKWRSWR